MSNADSTLFREAFKFDGCGFFALHLVIAGMVNVANQVIDWIVEKVKIFHT